MLIVSHTLRTLYTFIAILDGYIMVILLNSLHLHYAFNERRIAVFTSHYDTIWLYNKQELYKQ